MIQKKLLKIQEKGLALKRNASNPYFKSMYVTLDNILENYNSILTENKILCYHYSKDNKLITCLYDTEDDTKIESEFNIYNNDPQKQGSEITYGKRYNLGQLLNIQTDEDDDGNIASSNGNTQSFYEKPPYQEQDNKQWLNINNDNDLENLRTKMLEKGMNSKELLDKLKQTYKISKANQEKIINLY